MEGGRSRVQDALSAGQNDPIAGARLEATYRVRIAFGAVALMLIAVGLAARVWRHDLGLSEESAGIVATSLALAATLYAGILVLWDRRAPGRC